VVAPTLYSGHLDVRGQALNFREVRLVVFVANPQLSLAVLAACVDIFVEGYHESVETAALHRAYLGNLQHEAWFGLVQRVAVSQLPSVLVNTTPAPGETLPVVTHCKSMLFST